jgi:hypothetical protein
MRLPGHARGRLQARAGGSRRGGPAGHRPHCWTGYQVERLRSCGRYGGSVGGSRLARRSSTSSSRCTSSLRISSSRAWRAACQSGSLTALTSSACASPAPRGHPSGVCHPCPSDRALGVPLPAGTSGHERSTKGWSVSALTWPFGVGAGAAVPLDRAFQARDRHSPTMPLSEGGTDGGHRRSHRSCLRAGQIRQPGHGAAEDHPGRRCQASRRGSWAPAGGGPGQPAGAGGCAQPGTIAGGLGGRSAPTCLGWRRNDHSAGHGGEAR